MSLQKIALVAVAGVVLAGCSLTGGGEVTEPEVMIEAEGEMMEKDDAMMEKDESMMEGEAMMEGEMTTYTMAEVSEHATVDDCWIVVNDGVYDVTSFAQSGKHPGGDISGACGNDATEMFFDRPGDKGPHPESAQDFLGTMQIGVVQTAQ